LPKAILAEIELLFLVDIIVENGAAQIVRRIEQILDIIEMIWIIDQFMVGTVQSRFNFNCYRITQVS